MIDNKVLARRNTLDPSPCDLYQCENREMCLKEALACVAYKDYVIYPKRRTKEPGTPSRTLFKIAENSDG
jgi:hypothetical protein